jgi:hypothetical protein
MITNALKIDGWMTQDELEFLASVAKKSKVIVEIGSYKGRSTRAFGDNTHGIVYAVDSWLGFHHLDNGTPVKVDGDRIYEEFIENTKSCGNVVPFKGNMKQFLKYVNGNLKADFIFIDGDHRYHFVKEDILDSIGIVHKNGILSGHDYGYSDWPGVKKAVDEIFNGQKRLVNSIWWVSV